MTFDLDLIDICVSDIKYIRGHPAAELSNIKQRKKIQFGQIIGSLMVASYEDRRHRGFLLPFVISMEVTQLMVFLRTGHHGHIIKISQALNTEFT
jgi:hypothetical protein